MNKKACVILLSVLMLLSVFGACHNSQGEKSGLASPQPTASHEAATLPPSNTPSPSPTQTPAPAPTVFATDAPASTFTAEPSGTPVVSPTAAQTERPTASPSIKPTEKPTAKPTEKPTAKPTEKPTAKPTVPPISGSDEALLDNCAFVGNSTFEGLHLYGAIKHGHFFTRVGLNVLNVFTKPTTNGSVPVIDELNTGNYYAVALMFGENELGWPSTDSFINKYALVIEAVRTRQPNAEIFITGIPPVSKKLSETSTNGVNNENIRRYNTRLRELAGRLGCHFITVPSILYDANGDLPADASSDGLHLNLTYSKHWGAHICSSILAVLRD